MQGVRRTVGERGERERCDRIQAGGRQPRPAAALARPAAATTAPTAGADASSRTNRSRGRELRSAGVVTVDKAEHEQHRDRVVEARLALERPARAGVAASIRAAPRRSRRRRSTAGSTPAAGPPRVENSNSAAAARPAITAVDHRPDHGQADGGAEHRANIAPARRQSALEQDQRQRHDPDPSRQPVVVEADPAQPVGSERHPEAEHQHEARHAQAARQQRASRPAASSAPVTAGSARRSMSRRGLARRVERVELALRRRDHRRATPSQE